MRVHSFDYTLSEHRADNERHTCVLLQANVDGIQKLFALLSASNLSPDYELVAYCFEAFARHALTLPPPPPPRLAAAAANASPPSRQAAAAANASPPPSSESRNLKMVLADTCFPKLVDQIRREKLVAPGNTKEVRTHLSFSDIT